MHFPIEDNSKKIDQWGIAILSKYKFLNHKTYFYSGNKLKNHIDFRFSYKNADGKDKSNNRALLLVEIKKNNQKFSLATTKFTWTPDGKPNDEQRNHLKKLLSILEKIPEIILAGDFNTPRGNKIYTALTKRYQDNIPKNVKTTIDPILHKSNGLKLVVDYLFTTKKYIASNVKVIGGVSDHCAIVANIKKD